MGGQYEQAAFLMAHAFTIPLYAVVWLLFPDFIALLGLEPEIARTFLSRLNPLRFHSINSLAQTLFLCLSLVSCCYRTRPTIFALACLQPDVFRLSSSISPPMWADEKGFAMTILDNVYNAMYLGMLCVLLPGHN